MSGQQALTLVGQVVGGVIGAELPIGSAVGAAVGGAVGGVIGGALFNEETVNEGPRLQDLRIQTSSYGGAVPRIWGTTRISGNVIWCSDIREIVRETEEEGGKGGDTNVTREFTYEMDVAVAICAGPVVLIERIFGNGVLIWDQRFGAVPRNIYGSQLWSRRVNEHLGTEVQIPDPLIEAAVGVGNASAYRGVAYVVIEAIQLTMLKTSTMPNFEFIIVVHGTTQQYLHKVVTTPTYFQYPVFFGPPLGSPGPRPVSFPRITFDQGIVRVSNFSNQGVELYNLNAVFLGIDTRNAFENSLPSATNYESHNITLHTPGLQHTVTIDAPFVGSLNGWVHINVSSGTAASVLSGRNHKVISASGTTIVLDVDTSGLTAFGGNAFFQYRAFWTMWDGAQAVINNHFDGVLPRDLQIGSAPSAIEVMGFYDGSPSTNFISFSPCAGGHFILAMYTPISDVNQYATNWVRFEWDGTELLIDAEGPVEYAAYGGILGGIGPFALIHFGSSFAESDLRTIWMAYGAGNGNVQVYQIDDDNVLRRKFDFFRNFGGDGSLFQFIEPGANVAIYADEGLGIVVGDEAIVIWSRIIEVDDNGPPLSTVVRDLCVSAGLSESEIDVTALTEQVQGFYIGQTMTARGAIESLRPGYFFDAVDGDKLKFTLRGGPPVVTFEYPDLGAGQDDAQQVAVRAEFAQETELPARVNIRYISKSADYQYAAQSARRETTNSKEVFDAEIPCVFTDVRASLAANTNLRDQWAGSAIRQFSTGLKYSKYEPTDVCSVDDGDFVRQVRVTRRTDRGSMIEWEARDEDALMYASRVVPVIDFSVTVPSQIPTVIGPTELELLDLPPLTELPQGAEAADYVAAKGYEPSWAGAVVDVSRDGGSVFTPGTVVTNASVMGATTSSLPDFLGGNVFDQSSRVRVDVGAGILSSTTHDLVLAGANAAVIGDEIIQFREAILVSTGVYDLIGLLRGRKGTEWAIPTHVAFERFVLLTTNLANLPLQLADRTAVNLLVRAASSGSILAIPLVEPFTTQLARLMPYSPAHLWATRDGNADWYLQWLRRDRYMNDWNSGTDVPMSEASELYDVEIMSGGTVLQAYTNTSTEYQTVPASVLGYSPTPSSITFRVYQKSAIVGRGFVAENTVTQLT